jgi:serine/threonine-protein kinase
MLSPVEMLAILTPLCDALGVAHDAGLVHRDVKASNIILADDGKRPVLLDFGLVKLIDDAGPGLTSSRSMLGTPAAMAPEQLRGAAVDARTDVYALGLVAFHVLTGQPAFGGGPGVVQSYLQVHAPRPRPSSKVDIDPAIDEPIARALMPDPNDRFSSARELAQALRAVIEKPVAGPGGVVPVIAMYAEGSAADIARVSDIAVHAGMIVATAAPDSVVAVIRRDAPTSAQLSALRTALQNTSGNAKIALGLSTATIDAHVVDGDALDVEGWAPYPISVGLWVDERL